MNEESQIEEMRAALRGDRERAEARRQSTENVLALVEPTSTPEPAPETDAEPPRRRSLLDRLLGR